MSGPVLVVGATGQLGTAVVDRLAKARVRVRALVRPTSPREFATEGVELAFGDLREPESLVAACQGMATVVATANAVVPRVPGTFDEVEDTGTPICSTRAGRRACGESSSCRSWKRPSTRASRRSA